MDNKKIIFDNCPKDTIEVELTYRELYDMLLQDEGKLRMFLESNLSNENWLYLELVYMDNQNGELVESCLISAIQDKAICFDLMTYFFGRKNVTTHECVRKNTPALLRIHEAHDKLEEKASKKTKKQPAGYNAPEYECPF